MGVIPFRGSHRDKGGLRSHWKGLTLTTLAAIALATKNRWIEPVQQAGSTMRDRASALSTRRNAA